MPTRRVHVWQVAANEASGKKFPLAHRCIGASEWKLASQLESVLTPSHELVSLMQLGSGMDPGTTHLLARSTTNVVANPRVQLVSGSEGKETWKEVHEGTLDVMMRTYRREFVAQMKTRFSIDSHPGKHVLLCWKINPALDTSEQSTIFLGKPSVYQLMEGEYLHKLRHRYQHSISASPSGSGTTAPTVAPTVESWRLMGQPLTVLTFQRGHPVGP